MDKLFEHLERALHAHHRFRRDQHYIVEKGKVVISFNGEGWLASPLDKPTLTSTGVWPASSAMHIVERWRRVDGDTLEYRARVEASDLLTMPWETPAVRLKRQPVDVIDEALCRPEDGAETYLARLGS